MNALKKIALIGIVILIIGIVGRMDFDDQVQLARYKCDQANGTWTVEDNGNKQYCK